jgi:hypothetical protein
VVEWLAGPAGADDVDRFAERPACLPGRAVGTAHAGDRVDEPASAEAELEPAAAEDVDGRGLLGEHRRRTQRQVGHVGEEVHIAGLRGQPGDLGKRVDETGVVRMVLDPDVLQAVGVGDGGDAPGDGQAAGVGVDVQSEPDRLCHGGAPR